MNDIHIIDVLVKSSYEMNAVQLANLLEILLGERLSQGAMIMYFKRSFPEVPLRVIINASGWSRVSNGGLSDDDVIQLLQDWLPRR